MSVDSLKREFTRLLRIVLDIFGRGRGGGPRDPFAYRLSPTRKRPPQRSGAVAVAEPDDN
jgi:hypothetical protein